MNPQPRASWRWTVRASLLGATLALATAACSDPDGAASGDHSVEPSSPAITASDGQTTGSLSFELVTQGGVKFDTFNYVISGANFVKSAQIDVSKSSTVSVLVDGIPVASGYAITLSGDSLAPDKATCSGSAAFDISAGAVSKVPVSISCHLNEVAVAPAAVSAPMPAFVPWLLGCALLALGWLGAGRVSLAKGPRQRA